MSYANTNTALVERVQVGDTTALEGLWLENQGLLAHFAYKYITFLEYRNAVDFDDLVQAGYIGMHKAAEKYKPNRGATFSTYAANYINREIQRALGIVKGCKRDAADMAVSLDSPLDHYDNRSAKMSNFVPDGSPSPSDTVETEWLQEAVRAAVLRISSDNIRCAIWEKYWNDEKAEQIAVSYGITKTDAHCRVRRGIDMLRKDKALHGCVIDYGYST